MNYQVAIACGGTGGHLFPGLAVAEILQQKGWKILLLVSSKQIDEAALKAHSRYEVRILSTVGWPGFKLLALINFFLRYVKSVRECRQWFREWKPDAVLGMGGFTSAVPLKCAIARKIPTLIHESNAVPGRVTSWLANQVDQVLLGFEVCRKGLDPRVRSVVTGTPLKVKPKVADRNMIFQKLGLDPARKTILVMGGSQGAKALNELVIQALCHWDGMKESWQFIHLTGRGEKELVEINYRREDFKVKAMEFCSEMDEVYQITDLAISRSGAASLTELAAWGIASVLIPFPFAAGNHQVLNAKIFEEAGAATMMEQSCLTSEKLAVKIKKLLENDLTLKRMRDNCRALAVLDGDQRVADQVEALVKNKLE